MVYTSLQADILEDNYPPGMVRTLPVISLTNCFETDWDRPVQDLPHTSKDSLPLASLVNIVCVYN